MSDAVKKDEKPEAPKQDVVLLHSPTEDGEGIRVLRAREAREDEKAEKPEQNCVVEVGEVRPLKPGKPISGEVVRLMPREGAPRVCDVEVMANVTASQPHKGAHQEPHKGPAQVATKAYRTSWERIFGGPSAQPEMATDTPEKAEKKPRELLN